jgi:hypothetical protein
MINGNRSRKTTHESNEIIILHSSFCTGMMDQDVSLTEIEVTSSRLLEMIESAYPSPLSVSEMAKYVSFIIVKIPWLAC